MKIYDPTSDMNICGHISFEIIVKTYGAIGGSVDVKNAVTN